jgi:hypothetical protein
MPRKRSRDYLDYPRTYTDRRESETGPTQTASVFLTHDFFILCKILALASFFPMKNSKVTQLENKVRVPTVNTTYLTGVN